MVFVSNIYYYLIRLHSNAALCLQICMLLFEHCFIVVTFHHLDSNKYINEKAIRGRQALLTPTQLSLTGPLIVRRLFILI